MKLPSFSLGRSALQWVVFGLSASVTVVIVSIVYAAASWGSLPTVNSGSGLTAAAWNDLVAHVNQSVKQASPVITVSGSNVGVGTTNPVAKLDVNGGINISGSAQRITGDFTNGTLGNRVMFQSSTTNGSTAVSTIPNGTSNTSLFAVFDSSDSDNSAYWMLLAQAGIVRIRTWKSGVGVAGDLAFDTNTTERMRILSTGNVGIGTTNPSERLDLWGGNIKMGYETISVLKSAGWTPGWYYATCSAGKFVVGGACTSSSGTAPTNTDVTGTSFGCYLPSGYTAQDYQIKAICANVR